MRAIYRPVERDAELESRRGQAVEATLFEPAKPSDEVYSIAFPDGYLAEAEPRELLDADER